MDKRSPAAVVILTFVTLGIYSLIWFYKTKQEMVKQGADIPTCWLWFIPIADLYWCWKWSGGVEHVTRGKQQQAIAFLLVLLLPIISMAIIQSWLNQAIDEGLPGQLPQARVA
jgi:hypothetical protein